MDFIAGEVPLTLRRSDPMVGDAAGTWVLSSRSGPPPEDTRPVRDTIIAYPDGRAWRSRAEEHFSFATIAMWSRRGDWLVLDQLGGAQFGSPPFDSLLVEPDTLRRTTIGADGSTVVETFARVSDPAGAR